MNKTSLKDQIRYAERFALLLEAGVSLLEAASIIQEQAKSRKHKNILKYILADISNGAPFSESIRKHGLFRDFCVNIISVGEMTGNLGTSFTHAAALLKKKYETRRKAISTSIYPCIILISTISLSIFLMLFIFPKIEPLFLSIHMKLPLSTRLLIFTSSFLSKFWLLILIALILALASIVFFFKTKPSVKNFLDSACLHIPIVRDLVINANISNFFRLQGTFLKTGIGLSHALVLNASMLSHSSYKSIFEEARLSVESGNQLSSALKKYPYEIPSAVIHLLSVGEATGNLSLICLHIAEIAEHDLDELMTRLGEMLEPALMICMGLLVGFISISIITPIYEITQNIK